MRTNDFGTAPATVALSLDQLPNNQWATVLDVARPTDADDRELVLRLTEIGFVPGEAVRIVASGIPGASRWRCAWDTPPSRCAATRPR